MASLRELLTTYGLAKIADVVEAAAKPSLLLVSGKESADAYSRLGGEPNLPSQVQWPIWQGHTLPFVAQLDLAAIPKSHGLDLPLNGSLYFFYGGEEAAWGFQSGDKGSAKVIYSPTSLIEHPPHAVPNDICDEWRFRGVRLGAGLSEISLPDGQDQTLDQLSLSTKEYDRYCDFLEAWGAQRPSMYHRVGGYPEPIQGDPKLEAELVSHGLYCGDATGYDRGKELGLWQGSLDWELLLQVDSDENANMMWGDVGCLYYLIRRQDLALRAFERAWLVFQCY